MTAMDLNAPVRDTGGGSSGGQAEEFGERLLREISGLTGLPEIDAVLRRPGAHIADVGCGRGWSSIALARAYPATFIEGWDVDDSTLETARRNALAAGLEDRMVFSVADESWLRLRAAAYDAVFAFSHVRAVLWPVEMLAAMRRAVRPGGAIVAMDRATVGADAVHERAKRAGFAGVAILPSRGSGVWRFYLLTG